MKLSASIPFALAAAFLLSSCTHTLVLRDIETTPQPAVSKFQGKKIAIVFSPMASEQTESAVGANKFIFKDSTVGITEGIKSRLGKGPAKITSVTTGEAPSGYDYYLYPTLNIRMVNDFWTLGCLSKIGLELQDSNRKAIGHTSAESKHSFYFMGQGESRCQRAIADSLLKSENELFSKLN